MFQRRTDCCNRRVILYLAIPLLFAAYTTPTSSQLASHPVAASGVRACAVVTKADVVQVLGMAIEKGEEQVEESTSTCNYARREGLVSVMVQRAKRKLNVEAEIAALKASIPDSAVRKVTGLGARAFFLDIPGAGTQLYVIHGESDFLMVSVLGFGEASQVSPAAKTLARKALGRL